MNTIEKLGEDGFPVYGSDFKLLEGLRIGKLTVRKRVERPANVKSGIFPISLKYILTGSSIFTPSKFVKLISCKSSTSSIILLNGCLEPLTFFVLGR